MKKKADSEMEIKVHDQIACMDVFFWMVTKDTDDNKVPIIRASLQKLGTMKYEWQFWICPNTKYIKM